MSGGTDIEARIDSYLHYGYVPDTERSGLLFDPHPDGAHDGLPMAELVREGVRLLKSAVEQCDCAGKTCLVPLSGGLDSRGVAAALAETEMRFRTVTFGTPGTYDFDLGRQVALALGVQPELLDLTQVPIRTDRLVSAVLKGGRWTGAFDVFYNRAAVHCLGDDVLVVSGFKGGYAPSVDRSKDDGGWRSSLREFAAGQRYARSTLLTRPGYDPTSCLPPEPMAPQLGYAEQLYSGVRLPCYTAPILFDSELQYCTPLMDRNWVNLILTAPAEGQARIRLYEAILVAGWPKAFAIPAKNASRASIASAPAIRRAARRLARARRGFRTAALRLAPWMGLPANRETNYIDYAWAIRAHDTVRKAVEECVADLERRRILDWVSPAEILHRHLTRRADHSDALAVLVGLEVNLKAEEESRT